MNISIIPTGQWGAALITPLLLNNHTVTLWFRREEDALAFNTTNTHPKLAGIIFPESVTASSNLAEVLKNADVVMLACTSQAIRGIISQATAHIPKDALVISIAKGIERNTYLRSSEIAAEIDHSLTSRFAVLSGPNFAQEVAEAMPSASIIASTNITTAQTLQRVFNTPLFKIYTSQDMPGVELSGALKNIIAIAAGICDGLALGENARAALITRGFAEICSLAVAYGAKERTIYGLSGLGDLLLTATGEKSRNHKFGKAFAQGTLLEDETVEGLSSIDAALHLAEAKGINLHIVKTLKEVLDGKITPEKTIAIMMRETHSSEYLEG